MAHPGVPPTLMGKYHSLTDDGDHCLLFDTQLKYWQTVSDFLIDNANGERKLLLFPLWKNNDHSRRRTRMYCTVVIRVCYLPQSKYAGWKKITWMTVCCCCWYIFVMVVENRAEADRFTLLLLSLWFALHRLKFPEELKLPWCQS